MNIDAMIDTFLMVQEKLRETSHAQFRDAIRELGSEAMETNRTVLKVVSDQFFSDIETWAKQIRLRENELLFYPDLPINDNPFSLSSIPVAVTPEFHHMISQVVPVHFGGNFTAAYWIAASQISYLRTPVKQGPFIAPEGARGYVPPMWWHSVELPELGSHLVIEDGLRAPKMVLQDRSVLKVVLEHHFSDAYRIT